MRRAEYAHAPIIHFDNRRRVGKRTCAALRELGFRRIMNVDDGDKLARLLQSRQFELAVFATAAAGPAAIETANLVGRIRRYDASSDPYTPMIMVTWNSAREAVQGALQTGTDHLLLWPFSARQLGARVHALISARRRFIETEDYMGPERRRQEGREGPSASIEVPNALRARIEKRPDLAPSPEAIRAARENLQRIKFANVVQRICGIAETLRLHRHDIAYLRGHAIADLGAIQNSVAVLSDALDLPDREHEKSFCNTVGKVAARLCESAPDLDSGELESLARISQDLRVLSEMRQKASPAAPMPQTDAPKSPETAP